MFGYPHLTLKEGSKVKSDHINRFPAHDLLQVGYNDLLNSENLKEAIAQLCHDIEVCNFTMLQLTKNYVNNIFKQNTLNVIIFKLQLIYSRVRTSK